MFHQKTCIVFCEAYLGMGAPVDCMKYPGWARSGEMSLISPRIAFHANDLAQSILPHGGTLFERSSANTVMHTLLGTILPVNLQLCDHTASFSMLGEIGRVDV